MKRIAQKEQTRDHLLNMAYGQFSQKGFLATKTLDIAKAAGLSHGALFVHFTSREELLEKVIDAFGVRLGAKLKELVIDGSAKKVLAAHLDAIEEYEGFYAKLVIAMLLPLLYAIALLLIQRRPPTIGEDSPG